MNGIEFIKLRIAANHLLDMLIGIDWSEFADNPGHAEDIGQAIKDVRGQIDLTAPGAGVKTEICRGIQTGGGKNGR